MLVRFARRAEDWVQGMARRAVRQPMVRSAVIYASATAGVKVVAFIKEAVVAAAFGVSGAMDAYLMGLMLIGVPLGLLLNAIQTAFIPLFVEVRETRGTQAGAHFIRSTASAVLLAMTMALIMWLGILPWVMDIVGHGFDTAKQTAVRDMFLWLVPYYFLNGLNLLGYGALQADKRFLSSAILPVCIPLVTIAIVLGVGRGDVHELVLGLVMGSFLEWVVIHWRLRQSGASLLPGCSLVTPETRRLAQGAGVLIGGTFVLSFTPMIEQGLASGLGEGTVAAMGYAFKLPAMINGILVTSVGVTVLPYFAEMLARGDDAACRRAFRHYALALLTGGIVLALITMALSEPLVALVFQRGAFQAEDTRIVAGIQRAYLLQIPSALVGMLAVRLLVAQGVYGVVSVISFLSVVVSGVMAWALSRHLGAVGIALGLSIGASVSAVVLVVMAWRRFAKTPTGGECAP